MRTGGIKSITSLFDKYARTLIAPQGTVIAASCEVIGDVCGITVLESNIRYTPHSRVLSLQLRGPERTEVLLRKEEVLIHLQGRLGPKNAPKDIR